MDAASPLPGPSTLLRQAREHRSAGRWPELAALLAPLGDGVPEEEPELGFVHALALRITGAADRALEVADATGRAAARRGDHRLRVRATNLAGVALFEAGRLGEAEARWEDAYQEAVAAGDDQAAAQAGNNLGVAANVRGRRELALARYGRALADFRRLGDARGAAEAHHNLGISYRGLGFDDEADRHFLRAIALAERAGAEDVVGLAETERAMLRARAGDGELAEALAARALERLGRLGEALAAAEALRVRALAARARGRDGDARRWLDEALATARAHADPLLLAEVQRDRGVLLRDAGERDASVEALEESAEAFGRAGAAAEEEAVRAMVREPGLPG
jgi:tetratricopeptide (TPR) repeat protein